mmetsp:Transcript_47489/g.118796  ORF Transcript_47489/g.118796 Transcript_47489/m.118796 type:complete len:300 (+) Transcript_47489:297-1196(+)
MRAVHPARPLCLSSSAPPCEASDLTTSSDPFSHALISGVHPSSSWASCSCLPPVRTSSSATSQCPAWAAQCSAVRPLMLVGITPSGPACSINCLSSDTLPVRDAQMMAVLPSELTALTSAPAASSTRRSSPLPSSAAWMRGVCCSLPDLASRPESKVLPMMSFVCLARAKASFLLRARELGTLPATISGIVLCILLSPLAPACSARLGLTLGDMGLLPPFGDMGLLPPLGEKGLPPPAFPPSRGLRGASLFAILWPPGDGKSAVWCLLRMTGVALVMGASRLAAASFRYSIARSSGRFP